MVKRTQRQTVVGVVRTALRVPEDVCRIQPGRVPAESPVVAAHGASVTPAVQDLAAKPGAAAGAGGPAVLPSPLFSALEVQADFRADGFEVGRGEVQVDQQPRRLRDQRVVLQEEFFDLGAQTPAGVSPTQRGPVVFQWLTLITVELPQLSL